MAKLIDDSVERQRKNGRLEIKLMPVKKFLWKIEVDMQTWYELDKWLVNVMCEIWAFIWLYTTQHSTH